MRPSLLFITCFLWGWAISFTNAEEDRRVDVSLRYRLTVNVGFDLSFQKHFRNSAHAEVKQVLAEVKTIFTHNSLKQKIDVSFWNNFKMPYKTLKADDSSMKWLQHWYLKHRLYSRYWNGKGIISVFLAYDPESMMYSQGIRNVLLIANNATLCDHDLTKRTAIVKYYNSTKATAQLVAHAIANILGIQPDFTGKNGTMPRYDSRGEMCTGNGSFMDNEPENTRWSTCSNEDFENYKQKVMHYWPYKFCLEQNNYHNPIIAINEPCFDLSPHCKPRKRYCKKPMHSSYCKKTCGKCHG